MKNKNQLIRMFWPKGFLGWVSLGAGTLLFAVLSGKQLTTPKGILLMLALGALLFNLAFTVPETLLWRFELLPLGRRRLIAAAIAYTLTVLVGRFSDLIHAHNLFQVLIPLGAAPWTWSHWNGCLFAAYAWSAQRYYIQANPPEDYRRLIRGSPIASQSEAESIASRHSNHN